MAEDYGSDDYSEGVFGGSLGRIIDTALFSYFPEVFPRDFDRVIDKYINAHNAEFQGFDVALSYVIQSHHVLEAEGKDLNRIGKFYGLLGERGEREREEYRTFLTNLVESFNARGTVSGLKFAIASAANTDPENVIIEEDFENNEYEISIQEADSNFISTAINDLAELADPSAVELAAPPVLITTGDEIVLTSNESTVVDTTEGLGAGTLTLDGNSTLQ
jgi:hypothetical protein